MLRYAHIIVLILALIINPTPIKAEKNDLSQFYRDNYRLSSSELYTKALNYSWDNDLADSALVCYTILSNRFSPDLPLEEKILCIKAIAQMAYQYYFHYYDYTKALEHIALAEEMMEDIGQDITEVNLYYGLMYCSISEQSLDHPTVDLSLEYLHKAFKSGVKEDNMHNVNIAFSNMISLCYQFHALDTLANDWLQYREIAAADRRTQDNFDGETNYITFVEKIYEGLTLISKEKYAEADACFDYLLDCLPDAGIYSRYLCGVWEFKSELNAKAGNLAKAIDCSLKALDYAQRYNIQDAKIDIYRGLTNLSAKQNLTEQKYKYQDLYISIKDSLLSYRQVANIDQSRFQSEMRKVQAEKERDLRHQRELERLLWIGAGLLLITLAFLSILYLKNRQLWRTNQKLYQKNQELFRAEDEERRLRSENRQSRMTDEERDNIIDRIDQAMQQLDEICSPDFTVDRLAELVGAKTRQVSEVINDHYGYNFNTYVNNFRIREACRRLSDPEHQSTFTIEALSQSLGFKSRSTFVIQFKRVTGMTPSQYQKMADSPSA